MLILTLANFHVARFKCFLIDIYSMNCHICLIYVCVVHSSIDSSDAQGEKSVSMQVRPYTCNVDQYKISFDRMAHIQHVILEAFFDVFTSLEWNKC